MHKNCEVSKSLISVFAIAVFKKQGKTNICCKYFDFPILPTHAGAETEE